MKFGANSFIWTDSFGEQHFQLLPRLKEAGLDGIEICLLDPASFPAAAFRKELEKCGLGCTTCSIIPKDANLIAEDKILRRKAREYIETCLKVTAESGSRMLCGPLYAPAGVFSGHRRTAQEWQRAVDGWREIAPLASKLGVEVAVEPLNRFEGYFLNMTADAATLYDEIGSPQVGILFDTFHANIEEKSIGQALREAGKHLKHIHSCENDRGVPGTGHLQWAEFFSATQSMAYDGWLVIESFGFNLGALSAAASIWRDLADKPESIAFEGVRFLRKWASV